jgi:RsiW-degrading membrane proteinase PrsW (M82 family)
MFIAKLLLFLFISAIPSLLYILVIKLTSPYKSISTRIGLEYFGIGFGSVLLLLLLIPLWPTYNIDPFYDFFLAVAPREELVKMLVFFLIYKLTDKPKGSHPVSTMFYFGMVGLGFAMFENVTYALQYGPEVLMVRFMTATIGHMLFGMFAGYWIALGEIKYKKYTDRSVFGNIMYGYPTVKFIIMMIIGYLSATIYHGLWNFNLATSGSAATSIMFLMVIFGLIGAKFGAKNLDDKYRKSLG